MRRADPVKDLHPTPPPGETLDHLLDRWLDGRTDVRDVTRQGYRDVLVPVRQRLGDRAVETLTVHDVAALTEWMGRQGGRRGQPLAPRSVAASLGALAQALDLAVDDGHVPGNVARAVNRPRPQRPETSDWTLSHAEAFRAAAGRDRLAGAWLLLLAGVRRGELLALRWSDIDLVSGDVRIAKVRVAVTSTSVSEHGTRGRSAERTLPTRRIPGLLQALRGMHAQKARERLLLGPTYAESGYVVVDEQGKPVRPEWFSDRFRSLCRSARVPEVPLPAVRRCAVTSLLVAGIPLEQVAAWLGLAERDIAQYAGTKRRSVRDHPT